MLSYYDHYVVLTPVVGPVLSFCYFFVFYTRNSNEVHVLLYVTDNSEVLKGNFVHFTSDLELVSLLSPNCRKFKSFYVVLRENGRLVGRFLESHFIITPKT